MAEAVVHQSQQGDAGEDTRRELEPGAAAANGQPPDHAAEDTGNDSQDAIALRRLLAVATLTPAQAGLLAMDLMDTLVSLDERGECPDQVNDRSVHVRRDGTVVVTRSLHEAATAAGSSASTATSEATGANGTAPGTAAGSEANSGGSDTGETAAGGSANGSASTETSSNGGKGKAKNSTASSGEGSRPKSGNTGGTTTRGRGRSQNGTAQAAERGVDRLPVAATTANSLVRLLVAHTRGGSARRKVDAALLTDRLAGTSTDLSELRDKVRNVVTELATGDGAGWDDWTTTTRRQLTALVTATEGRTALQERTRKSGSARHGADTAGRTAGGLATEAGGAQVASTKDSQEPDTDEAEASGAATATSSLSLARRDLRGARRRAWYRKRRLPGRKAVVITLVVALVGIAGWWAVPRALSELRRGWEAVFTTSEPSQQLPPLAPPEDESSGGTTTGKGNGDADTNTEASTSDDKPGPVPRLAPKEAGPINGVTIERAEGECTRGEVCPVRVDVRLDPATSTREISWSLRIVDRCTDKIRKSEGVAMAAASGWRQVYGISRPALPDSRALALVAVTDTPAKAASAPLLVSANRATC